jgi:hypothetical protein
MRAAAAQPLPEPVPEVLCQIAELTTRRVVPTSLAEGMPAGNGPLTTPSLQYRRVLLMQADLTPQQKQSSWEAPRNLAIIAVALIVLIAIAPIAILVRTIASITTTTAGLLRIGSQPELRTFGRYGPSDRTPSKAHVEGVRVPPSLQSR